MFSGCNALDAFSSANCKFHPIDKPSISQLFHFQKRDIIQSKSKMKFTVDMQCIRCIQQRKLEISSSLDNILFLNFFHFQGRADIIYSNSKLQKCQKLQTFKIAHTNLNHSGRLAISFAEPSLNDETYIYGFLRLYHLERLSLISGNQVLKT